MYPGPGWVNLCTLNGENVTDEFVEEFADAAVISTVSSRLQEVRSPGAVPTIVSKSESEPRLRGDLRKPRGVSSLTSIIFAISFSGRKTMLRLVHQPHVLERLLCLCFRTPTDEMPKS